MAKVTGPLMSMSASGKFAGSLVFADRLGTNVVRELVTPANPKSADQATARNIVRATGAAQSFANASLELGDGRLLTDKAQLQLDTPAGRRWNRYRVKLMPGVERVNYPIEAAIGTAGTAVEKPAWENPAAALTPAIL